MKKKLLLTKSICNSDEDNDAGVSGAFNDLTFLKCLSHLKNTMLQKSKFGRSVHLPINGGPGLCKQWLMMMLYENMKTV